MPRKIHDEHNSRGQVLHRRQRQRFHLVPLAVGAREHSRGVHYLSRPCGPAVRGAFVGPGFGGGAWRAGGARTHLQYIRIFSTNSSGQNAMVQLKLGVRFSTKGVKATTHQGIRANCLDTNKRLYAPPPSSSSSQHITVPPPSPGTVRSFLGGTCDREPCLGW